MIDARYLAFETVVQEASFDRAAKRLSLTQSAVSQRIRLLESELGQVLLVRSKPVRPTPAGRRLLPFLAQMRLLQNESERALALGQSLDCVKVSIGVNADSLATWFLAAVADVVSEARMVLDFVLDDQDHTHTLLANGEVLGCVSTRADAMRGCLALALGVMRYRCVASPAFRARHFPAGLDRLALASAPAIVFGRRDDMHETFLRRHFGLDAGQFPHHVVPSSEGFVAVAVGSLGYGFVPESQVAARLADGTLVDLAPECREDVALFWHHWQVQSPVMARLSQAIVVGARGALLQPGASGG